MASAFRWIGLSADGNTVVLNKFKGDFKIVDYATPEWLGANGDKIKTGVVIDVETTGLNKKTDQVIEVGLRQFQFNRLNGDLVAVGRSYTGLQDPGAPLSEEIKRLTGLTDDMLRGQSIDWKKVDDLLSEAHIVVAHNASFDRPFIERHCQTSTSKPWGCSLKQIDWSKKSFGSSKLDVLAIYHGFFTDSHRALNDVDALLHLLSLTDHATHRCYLNELLANARRPIVRVLATFSPFESKDILKERGYSWDGGVKVWSKTIFKDDASGEVAWMESAVYKGAFKGRVDELSLIDQFK